MYTKVLGPRLSQAVDPKPYLEDQGDFVSRLMLGLL